MKLDCRFPELEDQLRRMEAASSAWAIAATPLTPRQAIMEELHKGVEIKPSEIAIGPGGLLTHAGEQVLLYIKDTQSSQWTLENEPEKSRRFHIADCDTLQGMKAAGRFERYVVTNRSDGSFLVDWLDPDTRQRGETEAALKVCKNCLGTLDYRGYRTSENRLPSADGSILSKTELWSAFSIAEFLRDYATFFPINPGRRAEHAKINEYVEGWSRISKNRREQANWCCEECSVDLSDARGALHCHHRSGVVTDNAPSNLRVLCALCHAEQPGHGHMKVSPSDRSRVTQRRIAQGLPR